LDFVTGLARYITRRSNHSVYEDIRDLPITSYHRIIEDNDLEWLKRKKCKADLEGAWDKINGQLVDAFGASESFENLFKKLKTLQIYEIKRIVEDNESYTTKINITKRDIEGLKEKRLSNSEIQRLHADQHRMITQWTGRDSRTLSTYEFFNDLQRYEEYVKKEEIEKAKLGFKKRGSKMR